MPGPASSCCAPHSARKRTRHQPRTDYNATCALFVRACGRFLCRRACRASHAAAVVDTSVVLRGRATLAGPSSLRCVSKLPRVARRARSSVVERRTHNLLVPGSIPGGPTRVPRTSTFRGTPRPTEATTRLVRDVGLPFARMSTYHIDLDASKADGVLLAKLSGRAQAETIVKLLDELNPLAERDSSLRVLIDETDLGAGFSAQAISAGSRRRGGRPPRSARSVSRRSLPTPPYTASTACIRVSRTEPGGERLQRPRACEGLAP